MTDRSVEAELLVTDLIRGGVQKEDHILVRLREHWAMLGFTTEFEIADNGDSKRLQRKAVFDAGNKGANFTLDATNGLVQEVTLTASCSLTDITGLVGPEPFRLYVDLSGGAYTLTVGSTNFDGEQLTFSGNAAMITFVDFNQAKIIVDGRDW